MKRRYSRAYRACNSTPRVIKAKYTGKCAETGKEIKVGDDILYYPNEKKVFCTDSQAYRDFASANFDDKVLGHKY